MHIQEFAENSVDFQHFDSLHGQLLFPFWGLDFPIPFTRIVHNTRWEREPDKPYISYFFDSAHLNFRGKDLMYTKMDAKITFIGPGGLATFQFNTDAGIILLFQNHTPLDHLLQEVHLSWYAERSVPRLLTAYVVGNWIAQWKNDVLVWENKMYRANPMLVKTDGPIAKLRRWYTQFYCDDKEEEEQGGVADQQVKATNKKDKKKMTIEYEDDQRKATSSPDNLCLE